MPLIVTSKVSLELPASREDAYFLYSSLQRQPEWSPWLKSVEYDEATGTSKWVIRSNGVKVSWRAQNTVQVIASVLRLEAVERFVKRTLLSGFAGGKKLEVDRAANHSWTTDTDTDNATDTASFEAAAAEVSVGVETAVGAAAEVRNEMVAEESVEPVESGTGGVDSRSDRDINSSGSISGGGSDNSSSDAQAPGVVDNETTAVSTSTPSPLSNVPVIETPRFRRRPRKRRRNRGRGGWGGVGGEAGAGRGDKIGTGNDDARP
eukprot:jgi/Undpi1/8588/HiC_scaffold_25.g11053.m1